MFTIKDGDYEVNFETEFDRGYGVESAADEIIITIKDGELYDAMAFGIHFTTEQECEWEVDITEEEAFALIQKVGA